MKNLTSLILIAVALGLAFFYIRPEYATISDLLSQKSDYETALAQVSQLATTRDALQTQYNAIPDPDKAKLSAIVPQRFDPALLTATIAAVAARHGLVVSGVKVLTADAPDPNQVRGTGGLTSNVASYKTIHMSFDSLGTYPSFSAFLFDLESSVELIDVTKITVGASTATTNSLDFGISFDTYALQ